MKKICSFFMLVVLMSMVTVQVWADSFVSIGGINLESGTAYTSSNLPGYISSGSILYDEDAKTLTLNNLKTKETTNSINIDDNLSLTILLKGDNTITTSGSGINMNSNSTCTDQYLDITSDGTGSLNISASLQGVRSYAGSILIKNCSLNIKGKNAIYGNRETVDLTINNATVRAQGDESSTSDGSGAIMFLKSITLKNCAITSPQNVTIGKTTVNPSMAIVYVNQQGYNQAYQGLVTIQPATKKMTMPENCLSFTSQENGTRICFKIIGEYEYPQELVYSKTGEDWYEYDLDDEISLPNDKTPVYVMAKSKSNRPFCQSGEKYVHFESTGKVKAAGNIMTLVDNTGKETTAMGNLFRGLFLNCTNLVQAPELPATTLQSSCYFRMFEGCTNLTTAPDLPATKLAMACYGLMFMNCTSLTTAPELPATTLTLSCYEYMFNGCTNLTTAPALPATTLTDGCYYEMFRDCVSLRSAPSLPAKKLESKCYYQMFLGCTKLSGISVSFTEWYGNATYHWLAGVASYYGNFWCPNELTALKGSSNIPENWTVTRGQIFNKPDDCLAFTSEKANNDISFVTMGDAPTLPKLLYSYDGYQWKYYEINKSLPLYTNPDNKTIYFIAEDKNAPSYKSASEYVKFVSGLAVSASGNIMYLLDRTGQQDYVPDNAFYKLFEYTYLTTAPSLPATKLGDFCYCCMFKNTDITKAPDLPATTLNYYCYESMFAGCKNLNSVSVNFTDWNDENDCTSWWLNKVADKGTFSCPAGLDISKRGKDYIPEGWTIVRTNAPTVVDLAKLIQQIKLHSTTSTIDDIHTLADQILEK